ncbi:MAG: ATP-binding cassette domain-containing protein [Actinomycetia bacterium]|nr:ATP-binding cassette domain-containing protein [Actinomycetes bacterium]
MIKSNIIEVNNLKRDYKTYERGSSFKELLKSLFNRREIITKALKGISFSLAEGELVALLGPNGAGKSTTLKILTGILHPTSGDVRAMGYIPWKNRRKYVEHIGAVFGQKSQLIWDIPPVDSFIMNKAIYAIPNSRYRANLNKLVEILDASQVIKKPTRLLSLGERMKCEFIMAMLHDPKIVFLDEPTIGLDVIVKDSIRKFILEMNRNGTTFILATHDLGDVEHLAKKVIVINHGKIIFNDDLKGLRRHISSKKIVKLNTRECFSEIKMKGVKIINRLSDFEAELELDTSIVQLNDFMHIINSMNTIADMLIQDVPIEDLIKDLYKSEANVVNQ